MNKFKTGDKVKVLVDYPNSAKLKAGDIGRVTGVHPMKGGGYYYTILAGGGFEEWSVEEMYLKRTTPRMKENE